MTVLTPAARIMAEIPNPVDGLVPNLFGLETGLLSVLAVTGGVVVFLASSAALIAGGREMSRAHQMEDPNRHRRGKRQFLVGAAWAIVSLGLVIGSVFVW
ncbi:hypothetical protein [Cellulosimicrobium cellulans]|uniref:hypothetical protein n=1 Tax=Cellulosimicrobium cellulans TaxID=1710 RepID=UPI0020CB8EE6|nr:hypothetical protein NMQ07_19240 [Cellulosimicrobium cellulans]